MGVSLGPSLLTLYFLSTDIFELLFSVRRGAGCWAHVDTVLGERRGSVRKSPGGILRFANGEARGPQAPDTRRIPGCAAEEAASEPRAEHEELGGQGTEDRVAVGERRRQGNARYTKSDARGFSSVEASGHVTRG